jgi:hypothetical protein
MGKRLWGRGWRDVQEWMRTSKQLAVRRRWWVTVTRPVSFIGYVVRLTLLPEVNGFKINIVIRDYKS